MNLFDLGAGLVLIVSVLTGWIRGGAREVATVAVLILAAVASLASLRFSGPIARHAIHTLWLANIAAVLIVFVAAYILLRVLAGSLAERVRRTSGLGGVDRLAGAGFGLARALVVLGLANLAINAITPSDRMPTWISGAFLYPVSTASAQVLRGFAPQGARLARDVAPVVGRAISGVGDTAGASGDETRYVHSTSPANDRP